MGMTPKGFRGEGSKPNHKPFQGAEGGLKPETQTPAERV